MIERFVDTSGWAEWADQTLLFHARAATLFEEVWNKRGRLITTGFVLLELTALLTRPLRMPKIAADSTPGRPAADRLGPDRTN